jgi:hypothetical protein
MLTSLGDYSTITDDLRAKELAAASEFLGEPAV